MFPPRSGRTVVHTPGCVSESERKKERRAGAAGGGGEGRACSLNPSLQITVAAEEGVLPRLVSDSQPPKLDFQKSGRKKCGWEAAEEGGSRVVCVRGRQQLLLNCPFCSSVQTGSYACPPRQGQSLGRPLMSTPQLQTPLPSPSLFQPLYCGVEHMPCLGVAIAAF